MTARNWQLDMPTRDAYWIGRVFYDVHHEEGHLERYRADPDAYLAAIPLSAELKALIRDNQVGALYLAGANPYLLRAHCLGLNMPEAEFLGSLRAVADIARHG
jgi:hypothetical protein